MERVMVSAGRPLTRAQTLGVRGRERGHRRVPLRRGSTWLRVQLVLLCVLVPWAASPPPYHALIQLDYKAGPLLAAACSLAPNHQPKTVEERTELAGIVVLARINATRQDPDPFFGTVATVDVMCAFEPFRPHFQTGTPIPGRRRIDGMVQTMVDIPGFGDSAACRSNVVVGDKYLLFLSNVSHVASYDGYEVAARYDDAFGATAPVTIDTVKSVMAVTAPEGQDCAEAAGVGWTGNCVSRTYRVPNGWTGRGVDDNYCNICTCWNSLYFCTQKHCQPTSGAAGAHAQSTRALGAAAAALAAALVLAGHA